MRIKSMTATFGKLDHARLEPGPGLTLIHAPNEGGKSTWAAFWRTMLYGIDTRGRDKKGTGLGLSIVKEAIAAHDEHINVISTEGVGTEFIFSLSLAETEPGRIQPEQNE